MSEASSAATALREKQKPLKDRYRSDPSAALVTLHTSGTLESASPLSCSLSSSGAAAKRLAGLHAAAGGKIGGGDSESEPAGIDASSELCSGDMLLESLVACFGVTVRAVATAMAIPIHDGSIHCEGDLDFRGTMGIKDENGHAVPVGFKHIRLHIRLHVDEEHKNSVSKLMDLSQRYCVVLQTLTNGAVVDVKLAHAGTAQPDTRADHHLQQKNSSAASATNGADGDKTQTSRVGVQRLDSDYVMKLQ